MNIDQLRPDVVVTGPIFAEPVQIIATIPMGDSVKLIGTGLTTNQTHQPILTPTQVASLTATSLDETFEGNASNFRLGIEAMRLGLAYEYDPYFSLSIARVDPLPHQLEAVYDYLLKSPRIRFLLADDPGAGKTIMAGLLIKELKIRGLVKRILIVTPANLSFQWQREMKDKFRENFEVIRGDVLRANYGSNPWQERDQVVTSVSWVSRIDDARDSLLRSEWDLVIVDEAHRMSAANRDHKTLAYRLGEELSERTDHYMLMTATPHKGDPVNFCLFLELLDRDVYGDVKSLEEAMNRGTAPFYLRRIKEALVQFPDPDTGEVRRIFTNRQVETAEFTIDADEWDFYDALTRYVEDQSIKAAQDDSARGRALGFTMAMLQRRFASSIYAARRSLERMRERRQRILDDPESYRQEQIERHVNRVFGEDFDELEDDEQQRILQEAESIVASVDPNALRTEIAELSRLIEQAEQLESREVESKLTRLRGVLTEHGIFDDPDMKLLIFTEHKDTLDYLVGRLREWGLTVTQIHGGMKIGDRDEPGTRIYAEREFRESAQILVATEAAGEGINLQFCWFMINYDIPWNPVRLEQRMGRIHRYGQEHDCLVLNFVSTNTREGRVLQRLLQRLLEIRRELGTDSVFDVVGQIFPANTLERLVRDMYAQRTNEQTITDRIVKDVDPRKFREITQSALEGLAKRDLNLSAIVGKSAEAKERRLVPEVIEDFFTGAGHLANLSPREVRRGSHIYRVGRTPRSLLAVGERLEPKFGRLGREYSQIVFDKQLLTDNPTVEWVTPGHPLFESVRDEVTNRVRDDLASGTVFYDLNREEPYLLDVFSASINDGLGHTLHRRLFVVETDHTGQMTLRQPTIFLDLSIGKSEGGSPTAVPAASKSEAERHLVQNGLQPFLGSVASERRRETEVIARHVEISLKTLIDRLQIRFGELMEQQQSASPPSGIEGQIAQVENRLDELNNRLERRLAELERERECTISDVRHVGRAWVMPHPERDAPDVKPLRSDDEVEQIAIREATAYEEARGWRVESVESENRGFDLISRKPHPEDPATAIEVRFIEVKGRAATGEVLLSTNEHKTAERLKQDYWLYAVFNCATEPEVYPVQDPARLGWKPIVKIEHYHVGPRSIKEAASE